MQWAVSSIYVMYGQAYKISSIYVIWQLWQAMCMQAKIKRARSFYLTIWLWKKTADHAGNHRCLIKKNSPIALILPSRWQDGAESLGMETTSCLWPRYMNKQTSIKKWNKNVDKIIFVVNIASHRFVYLLRKFEIKFCAKKLVLLEKNVSKTK